MRVVANRRFTYATKSKIFERKDPDMHSRALDFIQAWYNFEKSHGSLRIKENNGRHKWKERTPAMAEGLTDHVWSLEELFTLGFLFNE